MGDYIDSLPVDDTLPDPSDSKILDTLFKNDSGKLQQFFSDIKDPLVFGIIFLLLGTPQVTQLLKSTVKYTNNSEVSMLCFKAVVFVALVYFYSNISLVIK